MPMRASNDTAGWAAVVHHGGAGTGAGPDPLSHFSPGGTFVPPADRRR
jgi:hypothetical protein